MQNSNVISLTTAAAERSDETLMLAVAKGDLNAFEQLVKRHQNRVYRLCYKLLGTDEDAWDVAQEVFIKVYSARESYVENAKFTTWLYRIANNASIDRIRQFKRSEKVVSMEDMTVEPELDKGRSPHEEAVLGELRGDVSEALAQLSERQRGMIVLKYYEGASIKEIADIFECATGTVKATLFQGLRNMRQFLKSESMEVGS